MTISKWKGVRASLNTRKPMPPEDAALRVGFMERKFIDTTGILWNKMLLMLTEDALYFSKAEDEQRIVLDFIYTKDLNECEVREDEDGNPETIETIFRTKEESRNCGRSYIFRTLVEDAVEWEQLTDATFTKAHRKIHDEEMQALYGHSRFEMARARAQELMATNSWQFTLATYVCFGFLSDLVAAQVLPQPDTTEATVFFIFDLVITGLFTVDLLMNLFANSAHNFRAFYTEWTNWFDCFPRQR